MTNEEAQELYANIRRQHQIDCDSLIDYLTRKLEIPEEPNDQPL